MNENNQLFPFPTEQDPDQEGRNDSSATSLPAFPGASKSIDEAPLSNEELREIRKLLAGNRKNEVIGEPLPASAFPAPATVAVRAEISNNQEKNLRQHLINHWETLQLNENFELDVRRQLIEIIEGINDDAILIRIFSSVSSLLPIKSFLRHGTPEQKLFAVTTQGERFLHSIAGVNFNERKRLIKTIARYLSEVSESCSFIQMEGEPFNPQYHERAPGSMPSGKTVREMHGFLVTARSSNQVVKTALVLT